jgi:hypothetical protein
MRLRSALAALLGVLALLGITATAFSGPAGAATPAHRALKAKAKGKKHKSKGRKKGKKGKKPSVSTPSVKLTGGAATITLTASGASALEAAKATLTATAPATLPTATQVSMPITGGTLNPSTGEGTVDLGGGFTFLGPVVNLVFFTSQSAVSLEAPVVIKLAGSKGSSLSANVGSPPLDAPFFTLKAGKPKSAAGSLTLEGISASLDSAAAEVMGKAFSGSSFTTGQTLANVSLQATTAAG